jgi:hypothetical protein
MDFIVDSDIQIGLAEQAANKNHHRNAYVQVKSGQIAKSGRVYNPKFIVFPGDLTQNGFDGTLNNCCCPFAVKGVPDQLGEFIDNYDIASRRNGIYPYSCIGNHDIISTNFFANNPVLKYVEHTYGSLVYTKNISQDINDSAFKDLYISSLSLYPDKKAVDTICNNLDKLPSNSRHILFWHYNMIGDLSDWWSQAEKDYVSAKLLSGKYNILCCLTGHLHETQIFKYSNVPFFGAGGNEFIAIRINSDWRIDYDLHDGFVFK